MVKGKVKKWNPKPWTKGKGRVRKPKKTKERLNDKRTLT